MRPLSMSYSFDSSGKVHPIVLPCVSFQAIFRVSSCLKRTQLVLLSSSCITTYDALSSPSSCFGLDTSCTWGKHGSAQCNLISESMTFSALVNLACSGLCQTIKMKIQTRRCIYCREIVNGERPCYVLLLTVSVCCCLWARASNVRLRVITPPLQPVRPAGHHNPLMWRIT